MFDENKDIKNQEIMGSIKRKGGAKHSGDSLVPYDEPISPDADKGE